LRHGPGSGIAKEELGASAAEKCRQGRSSGTLNARSEF